MTALQFLGLEVVGAILFFAYLINRTLVAFQRSRAALDEFRLWLARERFEAAQAEAELYRAAIAPWERKK